MGQIHLPYYPESFFWRLLKIRIQLLVSAVSGLPILYIKTIVKIESFV